MAMFPIDTLKTQMQATVSCPIKPVGVRHALQSILKAGGVLGLYRGIGAMGPGAGPDTNGWGAAGVWWWYWTVFGL